MGRDYFQTLTGLLVITCWWLFWCMECEGWNLSDDFDDVIVDDFLRKEEMKMVSPCLSGYLIF